MSQSMSITFIPPSHGDVDQLVALAHKCREAAHTHCGRHYELLVGVYVSTIRALVASQPGGCPAWTASAVLADQLLPTNDVARMLIFAALADVMDADAAAVARAACTAAAARSKPATAAHGSTDADWERGGRTAPPAATSRQQNWCTSLAAAGRGTVAFVQRLVPQRMRDRRL